MNFLIDVFLFYNANGQCVVTRKLQLSYGYEAYHEYV